VAKNTTAPKATSNGSVSQGGAAVVRIWTRGDTIRTSIAAVIVAGLIFWATLIGNDPSLGSNASFSLLIGTALGIVFERGRFCFFCIFRDGIEYKITTPFLSVFSAIAVGAIGYAIVFGMFLPNTTTGEYPPAAHIGPVSWVLALAAFTFGIGMALSGACISGHLYRLGQGSLRAISALIGALVGFGLGYVTWNDLYLSTIQSAPTLWLPHLLGYSGALVATLVVVVALSVLALKLGKKDDKYSIPVAEPISLASLRDQLVKRRWSPIFTGSIVGVIGVLGYLRIEPLGVTRQIGSSTRTFLDANGLIPEDMNGLDVMTGCIGLITETITNNGWILIGIVIASFAAALSGNRFKPGGLTLPNGITALVGGVLLGWGGMTALGCTVGVLLSSTQAFSIAGWVFFAFVLLGTFVGIKLKLHRI
jgi:uncharacterized membrane protein YedE/YeeE